MKNVIFYNIFFKMALFCYANCSLHGAYIGDYMVPAGFLFIIPNVHVWVKM